MSREVVFTDHPHLETSGQQAMTPTPTDAQIEAQIEAISYTAQDLQDIRDGIWLCPTEFMPGHGLAPYIYTRKILLSALAAMTSPARKLPDPEKSLKDDTLRTTALAILWWLAPPWDGCQAALKSKAFKCPNEPSACMCIMAARASRVSRLLPAEVSGRTRELTPAQMGEAINMVGPTSRGEMGPQEIWEALWDAQESTGGR